MSIVDDIKRQRVEWLRANKREPNLLVSLAGHPHPTARACLRPA